MPCSWRTFPKMRVWRRDCLSVNYCTWGHQEVDAVGGIVPLKAAPEDVQHLRETAQDRSYIQDSQLSQRFLQWTWQTNHTAGDRSALSKSPFLAQPLGVEFALQVPSALQELPKNIWNSHEPDKESDTQQPKPSWSKENNEIRFASRSLRFAPNYILILISDHVNALLCLMESFLLIIYLFPGNAYICLVDQFERMIF